MTIWKFLALHSAFTVSRGALAGLLTVVAAYPIFWLSLFSWSLFSSFFYEIRPPMTLEGVVEVIWGTVLLGLSSFFLTFAFTVPVGVAVGAILAFASNLRVRNVAPEI